ncbi:hypothetical protein EYW49_21075 [Siculibacillus lacustris]|uniref:YfhO family protein n=1 Tax=Siculibacillus lacustris TaxID=1549641 RepID=A0A4Q9VE33_9HYPH|nr:hypothetical protein [Siculibacillus lacustris]TBW33020.1 hypothetical protein EYW49_21075 [Siculibacillus lacustris]
MSSESPRRSGAVVQPVHLVTTVVMFAAVWLVLTRPWTSGGFTVPWDAEAHFRAQLGFLAHAIHGGEGITWNPYVFSGWTQISDPQSLIFVPAFMALALFDADPSARAMDAVVFAQLGLGALAFAVWFRDRGWHPAGGMVAALAFAFGGSAAWRLQHTGQVMSFALLPIVMLCMVRMIDRRSLFWGLLAGITAGLLALGRDQIALLGLYFLIGMGVVEIFGTRGRWSRLAGSIAPALVAVVGGLAVVVVPVVMTLFLAEHSNRPEIDFIGAGKGSLHPASLITAAIADLFGQGDQAVDFWGPPSAAFGVTDIYLAQNMGAIYAGALPIFAILAYGVARARLLEREIVYQTAALVFFVLYAIGWYTPAFRLFYDVLPGVDLYRRPADATFLIGFSVALTGGWLVHRRLTDDGPPAGRFAWIVGGALFALVFAILPVAFGLHADRLALIWKPLVTAMVFTAGAALVLAVARRIGGTRATPAGVAGAIGLVAAFACLDLAWNNGPNESTAYPAATYDALNTTTTDPVVHFLHTAIDKDTGGDRRPRIELVGIGFHWPNLGMLHGFETTLGYNPLRFDFYAKATGAIDHVAIPEQKVFSALEPSYDSLLVDMLGLKWVVTGVPIDKIDPKLAAGRLPEVARFPAIPGIFPAPGRPETFVYENPRALPRVLFVDGARGVDFDAIIASGRWPEGFDPTREVLLPADALPTAVAPGEGPAGRATLAAHHNVAVDVDVEAERAGWLVLNDVWHRWWQVEVDGRPAEMNRADVLFRAVKVEPGHHRVRFTYHPFTGAWADVRARLSARR